MATIHFHDNSGNLIKMEEWGMPLPREGDSIIFGDDPEKYWRVNNVRFYRNIEGVGSYVRVNLY